MPATQLSPHKKATTHPASDGMSRHPWRHAANALALVLPLTWAWPQATHAAPADTSATAASKSSALKASTRNAAKSSSKPEVQTQGPVLMAPPLRLTAGKSMLLQLSENAERLSVGNPDVADVVLINPREI